MNTLIRTWGTQMLARATPTHVPRFWVSNVIALACSSFRADW